MAGEGNLGWGGIARLGLVQAALGAIVVLATSTMNRVMVVELALPAMLPGALVALHYAVQILRPRLGFGSDMGGRRTPWIVGGMATLGIGGVVAAIAIAWMESSRVGGIALAVAGFMLIGVGVGSAGTSLLVLLAKRVDEHRRAAAATVVWLMMITGFVVTTLVVGKLLDPYSSVRLVMITTGVACAALALTLAAVFRLETAGPVSTGTLSAGPASARPSPSAPQLAPAQNLARPSFRQALAQVWDEPQARRFTIFVFVSMLAYSAQDLILEPFAGSVFGMTPGESTQLAGVQHGGVLLGMIVVAIACSRLGARLAGQTFGALRTWVLLGCVASAASLSGLGLAGWVGPPWPIELNVFALGVANGAFAVAAIGSMMSLAGAGRESREGVRMGLWGAAQAIAFGMGGFIGAAGSDLARHLLHADGPAYGLVFIAEAMVFLLAAGIAARLAKPSGADLPASGARFERPPVSITAALAASERAA